MKTLWMILRGLGEFLSLVLPGLARIAREPKKPKFLGGDKELKNDIKEAIDKEISDDT